MLSLSLCKIRGKYWRKYDRNSRQSGSGFDRPNAEIATGVEPDSSLSRPERIAALEKELQSPTVWRDPQRAGQLAKELSNLQAESAFWQDFQNQFDAYLALDETKLGEKLDEIRKLKKGFDQQYLKVFLSGKYDRGNALLYIYSGAGGVDAQDWAGMLLRMYQKYAANNGFGFTLLDQSLGEQGGTKSAVAEITGRYSYGYLKGEAGVHRLVRISPFSAQSLRHTSFALVDVLPEIADARLTIDPKDLKIDTYRSSGPGGQNVNKLETAVRITHRPTGLVAAVQSERSQAQNKAKALQLLESRLAQRLDEEKVQRLEELRADSKGREIEWANQIRSYVLNPYQSVKDHRTGIESHDPDSVLAGELDEFIAAELANDKNPKS